MSREADLKLLVDEAYAAYRGGQAIFVARFKVGAWGQPGHGELPQWSESLQALEAIGWVLTNWSTSYDPGGGLNAFPVFRRRDLPVTAVQDRQV
jgi:hypothetical protein